MAELSNLALDLRGLPDTKAGPLLFSAAQRLGLGQKIFLQIDRDPHALLRATAFQLRDAISWTVTTEA